MATDLERLVVSLSADIKSYERSLAKAQGITTSALRKIEADATKSMGRIEQVMGRTGSALAGFGKGLVIGGLFAAVAGLEELVRTSITSAAAIGDLSDKLGISSEKLQELQFGAVQANMSFDDLQTGLLKFSKALGQAQNGSGDLLKILEANGFTKAQIKALDYGKALDIVADLIKNAKNEQDGYAVTLASTGKGGEKFLELLRSGSAGLKTSATEAHKANAVIKDDLIKNAQVLDDVWAAAMKSMQSQTATFVGNTIVEFKKISGIFDGLIGAMKKFGTEPIRGGGPFDPALLGFGPPGDSPSERGFPKQRKIPGNSPSELSGFPKAIKGPTTVVPDPEAEAEKKRLQALADQRSRNIKQQILDLKQLFAAVDASNVQQAISTQLSRYDVDAKSADGKAIADIVTKTEMHRAVLETIAFAAQQAAQKQQAFVDSEVALAEAGVSAFQQWAIEGDKLSDVIANLAKQLAQAAVQASLFGSGPLAGLFGTGSSGGFFGSLFNTPKLYAKGGQIGSGSLGIVGEAGPELVRGPATVIPMNRFGGGVTQNITFAPQIDARGADAGAFARLTNDMRVMSRDFAKNVKNVVTNEKSKNPRFGT